jgi:protein-tyrosine phosphatase
MGVNRSATIVIAYLMKTKQWTFKEAFLHVRSKRKQIFPNELYIKQLFEYEKKLFGNEKPSITMEEYWKIALAD